MKKILNIEKFAELDRALEQVKFFQSQRTTEELWNAGEKFLEENGGSYVFFIPFSYSKQEFISEEDYYSISYKNRMGKRYDAYMVIGHDKRHSPEDGIGISLMKRKDIFDYIITRKN